MNTLRTIYLTKLILVTFPLILAAQPQASHNSDYKFALLGSEDGAYWVYAGEETAFYYHIDSDSIFATGAETLFLVKDKIFESTVVMAEEGIPETMPTTEQTEEILLEYMFHELKYYKNHQNLEIPDVQYKFKDIGRYRFMEWWYQISNSENQIVSKTNLSVLCFDAILNISIAVKKSQDIEEEKEFLRVAGGNLKKILGPLDIDKMAMSIQEK